jgi:hypothetical protein
MITMHKKYKTRCGQEVRLLCIDGPDPRYPVIGLVNNTILKWGSSGQFIDHETGNDLDLIEVLPVYLEPWKWYKQGNHIYCTAPSSAPGWIEIHRYSSGMFNSLMVDIPGLTYLSEVLPGAVEISQHKETK